MKLKEVVSTKQGTDIINVVNADDLHANKQNIKIYHDGTVTALLSRPDFISLGDKYVVDVMELKGDNNKHKTVISIDM